MPKLTYDNKAAIPEGFEEFAKEEDGKFVIDVVPKGKLDSFRENNINLSKERDALTAQMEQVNKITGGDLQKLQGELDKLRAVDQQVKDGKLKGSDAVEAEVTKRVQASREEYERQVGEKAKELQEATAERDALRTDLTKTRVDSAVTMAAMAADSVVNTAALPDVLTRAHKLFTYEGDKLVAKKDGAVIYGQDGVTPLQPNEWLGKLVEEAPYLAKPSQGGGAAGGSNKNVPGGLSSDDFNKLPAQERIRLHRTQK